MNPPVTPRFEALNARRHAGWSLGPHAGYGFLRRLSGVEVMVQECHRVACDLPMFWSATDTETLGLSAVPVPGSDWPVDENDEWKGAYIPLLLRTYPFVPGTLKEQGVGAYVDINSPMVSPPEEDRGEGWHIWFDDEGRASPALEAVLEVLRGVHRARQETASLGRALAQLRLLKPIRVPGATRQAYSADPAAVHALPPPLEEVFKRRGWLKALYAQTQSLAHLGLNLSFVDEPAVAASI